MSAPELVIFDCDGVLVDSEPLANRILRDRLAEIGLELELEETAALFKGISLESCRRIIEERLAGPLPAGFMSDFEERTHRAFRRELRPIKGIVRALDALRIPYCVASSGSHEKMIITLGRTGLLDRFGGRMFSATEVPNGKPAPDLFLHTARTMGVEPERCVVVEDSEVGVLAAAAAGMRVLGFAGSADAATLRSAGAETFDEMLRLPSLIHDTGGS